MPEAQARRLDWITGFVDHARLLWAVAPGWTLLCLIVSLISVGGNVITMIAVGRYAAAAQQAGRGGGVTLLVTHRFSTVAAADFVLVLDGGRIVEQGSHQQLIDKGGVYAELYEIQARGYR